MPAIYKRRRDGDRMTNLEMEMKNNSLSVGYVIIVINSTRCIHTRLVFDTLLMHG